MIKNVPQVNTNKINTSNEPKHTVNHKTNQPTPHCVCTRPRRGIDTLVLGNTSWPLHLCLASNPPLGFLLVILFYCF